MKLFVHKNQPKPWQHPFEFLLTTTPLFFGFFIFIKTLAVMALTILLLAAISNYYDWSGTILSILGVLSGLFGFLAWVVAPAVMYARRNRILSLVIALNFATGLFLIGFLIALALLPDQASYYNDCIGYDCF